MNEETIYYTGDAHRTRWMIAIQSIGKVYDGKLDPEYGSALYILTSSLGVWEKAQGYVDRDGIDFEELLSQEDWSGGYSVLIRWAGNLFNAMTEVAPVELMRLDENNFQIAVCALMLRRYPARLVP